VPLGYEVTGRCPSCRKKLRLLDIDDFVPLHVSPAQELCRYRGTAHDVTQRELKPRRRAKKERPSKEELKKRKRDKKAEEAKTISDGNSRLHGDEPRTPRTSVRTVSGGLPTLGKR
jgi:hypothetical protein